MRKARRKAMSANRYGLAAVSHALNGQISLRARWRWGGGLVKRHGLHRHLHIHKSLQRSSGVERLQRVQEVFGLPNHMVRHRAGKRHFPNSLTMLLQAMQLADELSGLLAGSARQAVRPGPAPAAKEARHNGECGAEVRLFAFPCRRIPRPIDPAF